MYRPRRLSLQRERELDKEYRDMGEICAVCELPITKWVQVGFDDWASGYYEECLNCGESYFVPAHHCCLPFCVKGFGWLNKLACKIRRICRRGHILVKSCKYCDDGFFIDDEEIATQMDRLGEQLARLQKGE